MSKATPKSANREPAAPTGSPGAPPPESAVQPGPPVAPAAPAAPAAEPRDELSELRARAAKADEHWERLLRTAADFDNFKKRAAREKQEAIRHANEALLRKLIPVLDSFEMALADAAGLATLPAAPASGPADPAAPLNPPMAGATPAAASPGTPTPALAPAAAPDAPPPNPTDRVAALRAGIALLHQQFKSALREAGLEEVDATGKMFDPHLHEAVAQRESAELPEGAVLQQLRKGYKLRDRLLRPASVIVARPPAAG